MTKNIQVDIFLKNTMNLNNTTGYLAHAQLTGLFQTVAQSNRESEHLRQNLLNISQKSVKETCHLVDQCVRCF